jgi:hypothetical protein
MTEPETHPAVRCDSGEVQRVLDIVRARYPYFLLSDKNLDAVWAWIWRHEAVGGWTEYNVSCAIRVLDYAGQLEHAPPAAPPKPVAPPEPIEEPELLSPGQISIHASEWELRQPEVTPAQVRDYLKRLRAHNQK